MILTGFAGASLVMLGMYSETENEGFFIASVVFGLFALVLALKEGDIG